MREKLIEEILKRSKGKTIEEAKGEWKILKLGYQEVPGTCLCGQKNIKNICLIRNNETNQECIIGNDCIEYFLNQDYSFLFKDIKIIARDITKAVSNLTIDFCVENKIIYCNEWSFYKTYSRIRNIESKPHQLEIRKQINREILTRFYWPKPLSQN